MSELPTTENNTNLTVPASSPQSRVPETSDDERTLTGSRNEVLVKEKMEDSQTPPTTTEVGASEEINNNKSTNTSQSEEKPLEDRPPPLPYNLREHKLWISIFWFLILAESTLIPIIFYFTISRLTTMRRGAMFAIITACFGFISGGEYGLRGLRLVLKTDEYRPLYNAGRWHTDSTHLVLGPPYFFMTALMIGFSIPDPPWIRGLSIIIPVGMIMIGVFMAWTGVAHHFKWRLRYFRLSSHVRGEIVPPHTFAIMEDICACDGGAGKAYREAAMARFNASPRFRRMLVQMLWAWATTAVVLGVALIVIAWVIPEEVAYVIGWTVPSVWGAIGAYATIKFGQRSIRIEEEKWVEDHATHLRTG